MIHTEKRLEPFAHHQPDGDDTVFTNDLEILDHITREEDEKERIIETYEVIVDGS